MKFAYDAFNDYKLLDIVRHFVLRDCSRPWILNCDGEKVLRVACAFSVEVGRSLFHVIQYLVVLVKSKLHQSPPGFENNEFLIGLMCSKISLDPSYLTEPPNIEYTYKLVSGYMVHVGTSQNGPYSRNYLTSEKFITKIWLIIDHTESIENDQKDHISKDHITGTE